ncbi:unnamed protein product [Caenorhabditis angaria]|uniref:Uncharacterized protein n=1 Tax=Caenorhabditis angaria TaxID=860376 RepID=A0A9P1N763_9PELO|nr:unnamed protein product [Caenorhabditis angaria]
MVEAGLGGVYVKTALEQPTQPPSTPPTKLMGPFEHVIKFSGLDCSRTRKEHITSLRGIFSTIIVAIIIIGLFYEMSQYMQIKSPVLGIGWAESTVYAFFSMQCLIAAICVICWTRDGFVAEFEEGLARVRLTRLSTNQKIDDYTAFHRKCALMIIPIFFIVLMTSTASAIDMRYYRMENNTFFSTSPVFLIAPVIDIFGCLATSLCLVLYVTVSTSLAREIEHFNKELTNSGRFQQLTLPNILNSYSKRHSDIIQLIRFANQNLRKYASIAPFFTLVAFINAIYILGSFNDIMEPYYFALMLGWAVITVGITAACFVPANKIQDEIQETAEILMHDDVLQTCGDDQMHHTYRVTLDRCQFSNSKIYFMNAFPMDSPTFNRIMFIFPNFAGMMSIYRQTLHR